MWRIPSPGVIVIRLRSLREALVLVAWGGGDDKSSLRFNLRVRVILAMAMGWRVPGCHIN